MPSTGIQGQNDNVVHAFKHDVENGNFAVCDCMIVDCSDPVDVRDHFVMPMLQKLVANMDTIDQAYLNEINELEKAFFKKYEAFIAELPEAKTFDPGAQEGIKAFLKARIVIISWRRTCAIGWNTGMRKRTSLTAIYGIACRRS